jgi:predicted DNA-binding transcriptional regulator YafY
MSIDYVTKSGYPITRTVRPIQMYMANTGNNILLTLTREWNDYRAYIIDNIQSIKNEDENFQYLI